MKSLKQFLVIGLVAALVGQTVNMNRAKADVPVISVVLGVSAGVALGILISVSVAGSVVDATSEDAGITATDTSNIHKQLIINAAADDAAAFIANDGQNATALLTQLLTLSREELSKQGIVDPVSDVEIAQAIVAEATK